MNTATDTPDENDEDVVLTREEPAGDSGFIKFYGLYWRKDLIEWNSRQLLGQPGGWMGKGKVAANFDRRKLQMNFWGQKGVYVL
ncbi:hypothetical protein PUH89_18350 [Rhodobacter capsulatus]|uniref:Uncharacterized protein n=1 Tax=Rhodobacter capsulatus TaxID=1061 RepID=A0A1G7S6H4_RHOCA|nr:hypothetical protein [Rhodobacter capsulatus]WER09236.1 hypothetical protein PUH89_18350 [Rhodobacter capsulatus]SDG17770.1 hypothetical protein SAMN04244550_03547 [Rhodobacter capsulatus]